MPAREKSWTFSRSYVFVWTESQKMRKNAHWLEQFFREKPQITFRENMEQPLIWLFRIQFHLESVQHFLAPLDVNDSSGRWTERWRKQHSVKLLVHAVTIR